MRLICGDADVCADSAATPTRSGGGAGRRPNYPIATTGEFRGSRRTIARMVALPSGTVTFLFSDIEGSTELSRSHGPAFGDLRAEHRRLFREVFDAHRGREIDAEGDAFFIAFERATDAVAAAVAAQRALAAASPVRVRIGLHTTEPHVYADGYVGVGVSLLLAFAEQRTAARSCCRTPPPGSSRTSNQPRSHCAISASTI